MVTTIHRSSRDSGQPRGSTQEDLRRHNLSAVLNHLHVSGPLSRAELTALLTLNRSTIAGLVCELAGAGLVRERADRASVGVGRPSLVVETDPSRVHVLAGVVAVDGLEVALVGLGGVVLARRRGRRGRNRTARGVADDLVALASAVSVDGDAGALQALVVAVPAVVRRSDGCVRLAPNLGWVDEPLGELLAERLAGLPVRVGNDADLGLLAEHRRGAARGVADVVFLAGEAGVGGGAILGGRPLTGAGGYAGELGHVVVRPGGRRCRCGARGCWETEIGAASVARALGLPASTGTAEIVAALRRRSDPTDALRRLGHYLGLGISTVVNLFNPRLLIIGGLLREVYPLVADEVTASLQTAALAAAAEQLRIVVPALGGDASLVGAAELAWSDLLTDPSSVRRGAGVPLRRHA